MNYKKILPFVHAGLFAFGRNRQTELVWRDPNGRICRIKCLAEKLPGVKAMDVYTAIMAIVSRCNRQTIDVSVPEICRLLGLDPKIHGSAVKRALLLLLETKFYFENVFAGESGEYSLIENLHKIGGGRNTRYQLTIPDPCFKMLNTPGQYEWFSLDDYLSLKPGLQRRCYEYFSRKAGCSRKTYHKRLDDLCQMIPVAGKPSQKRRTLGKHVAKMQEIGLVKEFDLGNTCKFEMGKKNLSLTHPNTPKDRNRQVATAKGKSTTCPIKEKKSDIPRAVTSPNLVKGSGNEQPEVVEIDLPEEKIMESSSKNDDAYTERRQKTHKTMTGPGEGNEPARFEQYMTDARSRSKQVMKEHRLAGLRRFVERGKKLQRERTVRQGGEKTPRIAPAVAQIGKIVPKMTQGTGSEEKRSHGNVEDKFRDSGTTEAKKNIAAERKKTKKTVATGKMAMRSTPREQEWMELTPEMREKLKEIRKWMEENVPTAVDNFHGLSMREIVERFPGAKARLEQDKKKGKVNDDAAFFTMALRNGWKPRETSRKGGPENVYVKPDEGSAIQKIEKLLLTRDAMFMGIARRVREEEGETAPTMSLRAAILERYAFANGIQTSGSLSVMKEIPDEILPNEFLEFISMHEQERQRISEEKQKQAPKIRAAERALYEKPEKNSVAELLSERKESGPIYQGDPSEIQKMWEQHLNRMTVGRARVV